jgi:hypothetical protein
MVKKKPVRSVRKDGGVVGVEEGIDGGPEEHPPILFGVSVGWYG